MGISPTTVTFLYALGHDAAHLADQGLERLPDPGIVEKARQEERILLVHDLGFGELVAASGATLPSVITFRLRADGHSLIVALALYPYLVQGSSAERHLIY
jgi:predicted nuclease of predicted toxin-antitoxin system